MKIPVTPKFFEGWFSWGTKCQGVILVQKEEDIKPLFEALVEQDEYWEDYMNLIKIAPNEINEISDLNNLCEYVGKTDIYQFETFKKKMTEKGIEFLVYQYNED